MPPGWRGAWPCVSLRTGLAATFIGILAATLLIAALALNALQRMDQAIGSIVDDRLPTAVTALDFARQTDALVAAAPALAAARDDDERAARWQRIEEGLLQLRLVLAQLHARVPPDRVVPDRMTLDWMMLDRGDALGAEARLSKVSEQLAGNLRRLDELVRQRFSLAEEKAASLRGLLIVRQIFRQQLVPRIRMLEGDAGILLLREQAEPGSTRPSAAAVLQIAAQVLAQKMAVDAEAIYGQLLAAATAPAPQDLAVRQVEIQRALGQLAELRGRLEQRLAAALSGAFDRLAGLVSGDAGLFGLRGRELTIEAESSRLLAENANLSAAIDQASHAVVALSRAAVETAARDAADTRRTSGRRLLAVAGVVVLAAILIMVFYVNRFVIRQLGRVHAAMLAIAAGRYDGPMPAPGRSELGLLGQALAKFRQTAMEAERREADLRRAHAASSAALGALEAAQATLLRQSRTDFLTGLSNRYHLLEVAEQECERARRYGHPLSVLMVDIDHFKQVNDRHGHQTGDRAIRHVAKLCLSTLRTCDLIGRLGGEEFAVILPETDLNAAVDAAERIRAAVATHPMAPDEMLPVAMTISVGVACWDGPPESFTQMLGRADTALYAAKGGGRNRVASRLAVRS